MNDATAKPKTPGRHAPPPFVKPLIGKPLVYRRQFKATDGKRYVAEFHEDKLVLRAYGGRRRVEYPFVQLWSVWTGQLL